MFVLLNISYSLTINSPLDKCVPKLKFHLCCPSVYLCVNTQISTFVIQVAFQDIVKKYCKKMWTPRKHKVSHLVKCEKQAVILTYFNQNIHCCCWSALQWCKSMRSTWDLFASCVWNCFGHHWSVQRSSFVAADLMHVHVNMASRCVAEYRYAGCEDRWVYLWTVWIYCAWKKHG